MTYTIREHQQNKYFARQGTLSLLGALKNGMLDAGYSLLCSQPRHNVFSFNYYYPKKFANFNIGTLINFGLSCKEYL